MHHLNETKNRAGCPATNAEAGLAGLPVVAVAEERELFPRLTAAATTAAAAITRTSTTYRPGREYRMTHTHTCYTGFAGISLD